MSALPRTVPAEPTAEEGVAELTQALAEERQRLRDMLDIASGWYWEADSDLCIRRLWGRFEELTGTAPARWLGREIESLVAAIDDAPSPMAEMRARRMFRDLPCRMRNSTGQHELALSGKPLFDDAGEFRGYLGRGGDVTAAAEAGRRIAALHRRFTEAIEHIPASLLLCDADDRIVVCNSATREYFPRVQHLLVPGTRFEDLVRAQAQSGQLAGVGGDVEPWLAARMQRHRAAESVITRRHEDGHWVQIIERRTSDGGIIGIRLDVTELKHREEALAEQTARAEAYAQELERSNRELEQFAYIASHDLQEPLRMVSSYCQLLQRRYNGKLDADADDFIGYAVEGAERMRRLINDLLNYSRLGRSGDEREVFPSQQAVELALANLKNAIAESGARIEVTSLPTVSADRGQLAQLFQNLIGNAIKFRREEPPLVRVAAAVKEGGGICTDMAHFTVADNGIGIAPEYAERVFLIFQRLHERGRYPGTGIGLAIARKVVENHGGRIWIESTPGEGSCFNFTIPLASSMEVVR
jgi:signal transduction histidine kinase